MDSSRIESIFRVIEQLRTTSENVQTKIVDISRRMHKFNQNALLDTDSMYLSFQIALLNNQKRYYSDLVQLIEEKLYADLVNIHDKILMLLTSLEGLDIEHDEEKNNIIQSVRKAPRTNAVTCTEVITLVSCSMANLDLVKRFTELFESYIARLTTENRRDNIHCANLTLTLSMRKKHIEVEYSKYHEQVGDLVAYFIDCTAAIEKQLERQDFLAFLTLPPS